MTSISSTSPGARRCIPRIALLALLAFGSVLACARPAPITIEVGGPSRSCGASTLPIDWRIEIYRVTDPPDCEQFRCDHCVSHPEACELVRTVCETREGNPGDYRSALSGLVIPDIGSGSLCMRLIALAASDVPCCDVAGRDPLACGTSEASDGVTQAFSDYDCASSEAVQVHECVEPLPTSSACVEVDAGVLRRDASVDANRPDAILPRDAAPRDALPPRDGARRD